MQNLNERIGALTKKIEIDFSQGTIFYSKFLHIVRSKYKLKSEDVEDVWQNVMLSLISPHTGNKHPLNSYSYEISYEKSFDEDKEFSRWIMGCLFRGCVDYIRRLKSRMDHKKIKYDLVLIDDYKNFSTPLQKLIEEKKNLLYESIAKMREKHIEIIELIDMMEMSYKEASIYLGISINGVKDRYYNARRKLKGLIARAA